MARDVDPLTGHRRPFHVVRWLGTDVLENSPQLIRMLHEARAQAAAREALTPVAERPAYRIRQARFFARGRDAADADADGGAANGAAPETDVR